MNLTSLEEFRKTATVIPVVVGRGVHGDAKTGAPRLILKEDGDQLGQNHLGALHSYLIRRRNDYEFTSGRDLTPEERGAFVGGSMSRLLSTVFPGDITYFCAKSSDEVLIFYKHDRAALIGDVVARVFTMETERLARQAPAPEAPDPATEPVLRGLSR